MFGYVRPYRPALTLREYEFYNALYCGVCHSLRQHTGWVSSFALNYDLVFLALVRLTAGEDRIRICPHRCMAHPTCKKNVVKENPATDYAARVLAILTYHKFEDDVKDNRGFQKLKAKIGRFLFKKARKKAALPDLDAKIAAHLQALSQVEAAGTPSIDAPAEIFGELLGEVFAYGAPEAYGEALYGLGCMLGKFIYGADAAEDYQKDRKKKNYNPFVLTYPQWGKEEKEAVRTGLLMILEEGESLWHRLPYQNTVMVRHLIENIMYDGLVHRLDFLLPDYNPKTAKKKSRPYSGRLP